jgi:hypothetical protein
VEKENPRGASPTEWHFSYSPRVRSVDIISLLCAHWDASQRLHSACKKCHCCCCCIIFSQRKRHAAGERCVLGWEPPLVLMTKSSVRDARWFLSRGRRNRPKIETVRTKTDSHAKLHCLRLLYFHHSRSGRAQKCKRSWLKFKLNMLEVFVAAENSCNQFSSKVF